MTYFPVVSPFEIFCDLDGNPLEDGYIYIGEANQNPITNQITVYWDSTGLYPTAQPIRTINGYPDRNGSPAKIYVNAGAFEDYSILINDKHGRLVFSAQSARFDDIASGNIVDLINDLRIINGYGQPIDIRGHSAIGDGGEGRFEWFDGAAPGTYIDNDGTTIVPTGGDGSAAWIRQITNDILNPEMFGGSIQAALDVAETYQIVVAQTYKSYTITSTLNINGKDFDGNRCTIIKNFAGIGIEVTGGPTRSYIRNFMISAGSTAYEATDYNASGTDHGIYINDTRIVMSNVSSNYHDGAGFYFYNGIGNMNTSQIDTIAGSYNATAGCLMSGIYPGVDNMSVWRFSGRFRDNWGYGLHIDNNCPIRQVDMWLYCENNLQGASAPIDYGAKIERAKQLTLWAYVEEQTTNLELNLGSNTNLCIVQSVRNNADLDQGINNLLFYGNRITEKGSDRTSTPLEIWGQLARIAQSSEYTQLKLIGNDGTFGFLRGTGNTSGSQRIGLLNSDETTYIDLNNEEQRCNTAIFTHYTNTARREYHLPKTAPTSNQITLTMVFSDSTSFYGSALIEIFLCADTGSTNIQAHYLGQFPLAIRAGASTMSFGSENLITSNSITVNASYPTVSGVTMTIVFDLHVSIVSVTGHLIHRGGMGRLDSAVLS